MNPLLIVNADDYGLTEAGAEAMLRAYREGIVTSVSVIAVGPAFVPATARLRDQPGIGVGGHLAAVGEDPPLLTAREIPTLVDRRGRLPASWRSFVAVALAGRIDPGDVEREFEAQLQRMVGEGLRLTHLDTHQHLHLWPSVGAVVARLARRYGVGAVRLPRSRARSVTGAAVRLLGDRLGRTISAAGLGHTAGHAGLDEAGHLVLADFLAALRWLAGTGVPSAEINCHPGAATDPARSRYAWGYQWPAELAALTSPTLRAAIGRLGFRLGGYADLPHSFGHSSMNPHGRVS